MASKTGSVWAIEIGNCKLKALRLRLVEEMVEVIGFASIEHEKILNSSGVTDEERTELVGASLRQFVEQNDLGKDEVIISVSSQSSFSRFTKLPPVEAKRIPEIVQYEAVQQIPFDINEVEWDWQVMEKPDSPDTEVGIFAINNEVLDTVLGYFSGENIKVTCVQMAPVALYNYVFYDRKDLGESDNKAIIVIDVGTENTDLVICTRHTVWQRCIPLGGNSFTDAIAEAFKLSFAKAEKLKRTAPMSKYAKQIFQAMKPVFADFAAEVQRSIGFYSSSNRDVKFQKVIALGGGTRLQGLTKYLQQMVQVPFVRPDSFDKLGIGSGVSAAQLTENVTDFGIVYGLGVQGLGLGKIETNLLPRKIARTMVWAQKARYLTAAACGLLAVSLMCFARTSFDRSKLSGNSSYRDRTNRIKGAAETASRQLSQEESKDSGYASIILKEFDYFKYRNVIPLLHEMIISCLPNGRTNPEQARLYEAFAAGEVEGVMSVPRKQRKQLFVTGISVNYAENLAKASFSSLQQRRQSMFKRKAPSETDSSIFEGGGVDDEFGGGMADEFGTSAFQIPAQPSRKRKPGRMTELQQAEEKPGFIVVIEGYSPYGDIYDLLDPAGVGTDKSQWGVVTRFMHLKELFPDFPFELYEKDKLEHFEVKTGEVEFKSSEMPGGIGIVKSIEQDSKLSGGFGFMYHGTGKKASRVLIDPMTKEVISKVAAKDENGEVILNSFGTPTYNVGDCWFRIQAKFVWKDAPKQETEMPMTRRRRR